MGEQISIQSQLKIVNAPNPQPIPFLQIYLTPYTLGVHDMINI